VTAGERRRPWVRAPGLGSLVADAVTLHPDRTAVVAGELELSYGELDERADRLATALAAAGVGRGDVVALALGNDWRFAECLLGVARAGAVSLLVNVKLGADALAYIADHSDAVAVIADAGLGDRVAAMRAGAPRVRTILATGGELPGARPYEEALAASPRHGAAAVCPDPDELALLMYTSGSTGRPKGVMLSHSSTWWQARSSARSMLLERTDRALIMGPLYHANALWAGLLPMLYVGGAVVVLPEFDARHALRAVDRWAVTCTSGTPSMFALLLAEADRSSCDGSSLELLMCGSAPVPEELMSRLVERFGCEICETYGLTEGGANVLSPRWGVKKLGSTGLPVPDVEIEVRDPEDPPRVCGIGEIGELWTRSPANALGYLKQPDVTAQRFTADGWLRTGDLVRRDEQGYVYFCGRTDDMISVGGENVYPKEVETILLQHPAVADVGVVPAAHPVKGEAPVAWVVLRPGAEAAEDELRQFFLAKGPAYAHPRRVFFRDALPVSGTNKLDRERLQREAAELLPDGLSERARTVG
jgi:long-chain acyl-CoA synthetase